LQVRTDTMLYPGYVPVGGLLPSILHYGADYTIEGDVHSMGHPNVEHSDMGHPRAWDAHRASRDANLELQCASGTEVYFDQMNL